MEQEYEVLGINTRKLNSEFKGSLAGSRGLLILQHIPLELCSFQKPNILKIDNMKMCSPEDAPHPSINSAFHLHQKLG